MKFISRHHPHETTLWCATDNHKNFNRNLKRQAADWEYRTKTITYEHNAHGFRTKDFSEVKWEDSIVIFGDSYVYGTGLAFEDTVPMQLETLTGIPTVSIASSGSSVDSTFSNSLTLYNHYPTPRAIVHLWTGLDRYQDFDCQQRHITKRRDSCAYYFQPSDRGYEPRINWGARSKLYVAAERAIWGDKVPRYEMSYFPHTSKTLLIDHFKGIDLARDQDHVGSKTTAAVAKQIASQLSL